MPKEYIPGVQSGLEQMMNAGVIAGFPVVDVKATLFDGKYHDVDSSVMAFEIAPRVRSCEGMSKCGPKLLGAVMEVDVITPEESMGDAIGDLNSRRGQVGELARSPAASRPSRRSCPSLRCSTTSPSSAA